MNFFDEMDILNSLVLFFSVILMFFYLYKQKKKIFAMPTAPVGLKSIYFFTLFLFLLNVFFWVLFLTLKKNEEGTFQNTWRLLPQMISFQLCTVVFFKFLKNIFLSFMYCVTWLFMNVIIIYLSLDRFQLSEYSTQKFFGFWFWVQALFVALLLIPVLAQKYFLHEFVNFKNILLLVFYNLFLGCVYVKYALFYDLGFLLYISDIYFIFYLFAFLTLAEKNLVRQQSGYSQVASSTN